MKTQAPGRAPAAMRAAAVALVAWSAALQARAETAGEPEYAVRAGTTLDAYTVNVGARHAFRKRRCVARASVRRPWDSAGKHL